MQTPSKIQAILSTQKCVATKYKQWAIQVVLYYICIQLINLLGNALFNNSMFEDTILAYEEDPTLDIWSFQRMKQNSL